MQRDDNVGAAKERPILFAGEMVRAILDGRKTQTRRAVKPQPSKDHQWHGWVVESTCRNDEGKACWAKGDGPHLKYAHRVRCPYGQPGDRLWVRETFDHCAFDEDLVADYRAGHISADDIGLNYKADMESAVICHGGWRPSIHMPRWASRVLLEVVSVRVERLNQISNEDAMAEGIGTPCDQRYAALDGFKPLWESINGAGSWDDNPWVWVVEFRRIDRQEKTNAA